MVKKCLYSSLHEKEAVGISEGAKDGGGGGVVGISSGFEKISKI